MDQMKAIVFEKHGEPEVLKTALRPIPRATHGTVVVRVHAFGLNHAEAYFRRGVWGDVAEISGIECVGEVHDSGDSELTRGQRVFALMGGMGRSTNGSYAEFTRVPVSNVVPFTSTLDGTKLATIPESYATAWTFLHHNLDLGSGQTLVVRGGTSALGQAAIQLARSLNVRVLATTRSKQKAPLLEKLGAEVLIEQVGLSRDLRRRLPAGVDGVLDIIGTSTLLDSFQMARYGGRVAMAGFLGGAAPLTLNPLLELPSGVQFSFFASAFMFGTDELPLSGIPFADFVKDAERGTLETSPAHVFEFDEIVTAHRLMESGEARGKIVVRAPDSICH